MPGDLLHLLSTTCLDATEIKQHTDKDPVLSKVCRYILSGWQIPETTSELQPYITRQNELSVLYCGEQELLFLSHVKLLFLGMSKISRSYVWWPKLNQTCQQLRPTAPLHPWEYPWDRLHIDFAGPFMGHMFLVLLLWIDVESITATKQLRTNNNFCCSWTTT